MSLIIDKSTILKYDVQGPRYTSYPTAPEWSDEVDAASYRCKLASFSASDKTLSVYVHIPFCEQLCYFCACMKVIRAKDQKYGDEYLAYLFREMDMVTPALGRRATVRQLHWGGGTPTFLSEDQIERLFEKMHKSFQIEPGAEIAIEVDPRTVTATKLTTLRRLGFNRVSMGVQDFDEKVMDAVNRRQSLAMVADVTRLCRDLRFDSVNFDLIYGLPHQTVDTFKATIEQTIGLKPDRVALYNFAYVPWMTKHQTKLIESDFPDKDTKLDLFLLARQKFLDGGYQAIAMDHFALTTDEMARAFNERRLFRNFMGYTVKPADDYIGLGVSAIGFLEDTFVQNTKTLPEYYRCLEAGDLPIERGKELTEDDRIRRWVILQLMCHFSVDKDLFRHVFNRSFDEYFSAEAEHLEHCRQDNLLVERGTIIEVTPIGQLFIRNICMGFDAYLRKSGTPRRFSRTV